MNALPHLPRLTVTVMRPPGCSAWRVSVLIHLEAGPPWCLEASAASSVDGWNQALAFIERHTSGVTV